MDSIFITLSQIFRNKGCSLDFRCASGLSGGLVRSPQLEEV